MCKNCWIGEGQHSIINERTQKAADLIQAIYECEEGGAGGYAHIVVDDWNIDDGSIDWCLQNMNGNLPLETKEACIECLRFLRTLSMEERNSAMAIQSKFIK